MGRRLQAAHPEAAITSKMIAAGRMTSSAEAGRPDDQSYIMKKDDGLCPPVWKKGRGPFPEAVIVHGTGRIRHKKSKDHQADDEAAVQGPGFPDNIPESTPYKEHFIKQDQRRGDSYHFF